ncbi:hypothetical protein E2C01_061379 [Portunus trituberculatus]|uniref:Uncharacterized protein n=1 Tax=Portunus trituberculatus TaxID=210409 RepID=A0A5B7H514_PORTR|nr:hypothetical protein [Portunus trituberculatus]
MFVLGKCEMVTSVEKGVNTLPFPRGSLDEDTELMLAARHVVARHLQGCHLIIAAPRSSVLALTIRETRVNTLVTTVLELNSDTSLTQHVDIWSSGHFTCRALLLHYTAVNINLAIRFLSTSQIWQRPEVRVVVMSGGEVTQDTDRLLSHHVLRNTRHVLHIEHQATRHRTTTPGIPHADVYYRCLFCDETTSAAQLTRRWYLKAGVPQGFTSLRGTANRNTHPQTNMFVVNVCLFLTFLF